ncbi:MAG TPA: EAL domain-containing protein [Bdellovibrionota bacterium]|nr:EAL domain-containing protein [Bdellovibrionota bacterium]
MIVPARQALRLVYQPRVVSRTRRVVGAEALLRSGLPGFRGVSPERLISNAERSGSIFRLSEWVMHTACADAMTWAGKGGAFMAISVNVTAPEVHQPSFVDDILRTVKAARLPPDSFEVEITESQLLSVSRSVTDRLRALRSNGIRIAVDDFGTGFASFRYLSQLPIDTLKIDRSFVMKLPQSLVDSEIVTACIHLGDTLGLTVVAEGVETSEQRDFLEEHGCEQAQGYLFGRPMPAKDFLRRCTISLGRPLCGVSSNDALNRSIDRYRQAS